jgi:hypothetical protein
LVKLGVTRFFLADEKLVSEENLSTQMYTREDLGREKVYSLFRILTKNSPNISVNTQRSNIKIGYDSYLYKDELRNVDTKSVVILAQPDSIESRREMFSELFLSELARHHRRLFVDTRMGAEYLEAHFIKGEPGKGIDPYHKEYFKWLTDDEQTFIPEPCGARSIAYTGMLAAGMVCAQIRRWMIGSNIPKALHFSPGNGEILYRWREGESYTEENQ